MKFKVLTIIFTIAVLGLVIISCQKEKTNEVLNQPTEEPILSDEDIAKIGEYHNLYLSQMFAEFDLNSENYKVELINQYNQLDFNQSRKTVYNEDFIDKNCNIEQNIETLQQNLSSEAFDIIEIVFDLIQHIESYNSFIADLESTEIESKLTALSAEEACVVQVAISVWKNSAYYWLPVEMGGSGEGYPFIADHLKSTNADYSKLESALIADGISGGVGMIGVAVVGALSGPIGWITLAVVAGESALNSGAAGLL